MTAEEFRVACARLNYSLKDMAARLQVSPVTCSRWAQGDARIPFTAQVVIRQLVENIGSGDAGGECEKAG